MSAFHLSIMRFSTVCSKTFNSLGVNRILAANQHLKNSFKICGNRYVVDYRRKPIDDSGHLMQPYVCFKFLRLIKRAIREFGPFVEKNEKLASLIKRAENHNVPFDFIDYAQKIAVDSRANIGIHELMYFNHGFFIVQYEDIDTSLTKHHCLSLCEKYDTQLVSGKVKWSQYFNPKGILTISVGKSQKFEVKKAEEIVSKIGAKSATKEMDLDDLTYWQFHCEPGDLHEVKKALLKENYQLDEAYVGFVPKQKITLPFQTKRIVNSIISDLNKVSVIDNVYTNIIF